MVGGGCRCVPIRGDMIRKKLLQVKKMVDWRVVVGRAELGL